MRETIVFGFIAGEHWRRYSDIDLCFISENDCSLSSQVHEHCLWVLPNIKPNSTFSFFLKDFYKTSPVNAQFDWYQTETLRERERESIHVLAYACICMFIYYFHNYVPFLKFKIYWDLCQVTLFINSASSSTVQVLKQRLPRENVKLCNLDILIIFLRSMLVCPGNRKPRCLTFKILILF